MPRSSAPWQQRRRARGCRRFAVDGETVSDETVLRVAGCLQAHDDLTMWPRWFRGRGKADASPGRRLRPRSWFPFPPSNLSRSGKQCQTAPFAENGLRMDASGRRLMCGNFGMVPGGTIYRRTASGCRGARTVSDETVSRVFSPSAPPSNLSRSCKQCQTALFAENDACGCCSAPDTPHSWTALRRARG